MDNQSHPNKVSAELAYQSVFLLIDDAVVIIDREHKIIQMNPLAETLLKVDAKKVIGQTLDEIMSNQHQIELSLAKFDDKAIALKLDDETRFYKLKRKQIPDQPAFIVIFDDVTKEQIALKRVDQLLAGYSNYAHTVGHDVKSPLGVAIGYSNMLQSELEEGTEAHIFADEIFDTSMRIMYICNELLLLSELQNPRTKVDFAPVNLNSVVDTALRRFSKDIADQGISINLDETMPIIQGNLPWVEEVLVNYLRYAIMETASSSVEIGADKPDSDTVRVWFKHNGKPLSATEQESLFDLKDKLEDIRAQGYGLGLGIAKLLIERLQGRVGIDGERMIYFTLGSSEKDG